MMMKQELQNTCCCLVQYIIVFLQYFTLTAYHLSIRIVYVAYTVFDNYIRQRVHTRAFISPGIIALLFLCTRRQQWILCKLNLRDAYKRDGYSFVLVLRAHPQNDEYVLIGNNYDAELLLLFHNSHISEKTIYVGI